MSRMIKQLHVYTPRLIHFVQTQFLCTTEIPLATTNEEYEQNKVITDKFLKELPLIKNMKGTFINISEKQLFASEKDFADILVSEGEEKIPITNVTGTLPLIDDSNSTENISTSDQESENSKSDNQESVSTSKLSNDEPESLKSAIVINTDTCDVKKDSSVFIVPTQDEDLPNCMDLSTILVPQTLQYNEKNLILDSVVQDLQHMYYYTSDTIRYLHLMALSQGQLSYETLDKFFKKPGTPQNYVRVQAVTAFTVVKEKTSAALCKAAETKDAQSQKDKPKETSQGPKKEGAGSFLDTIMSTINGIIETIKQKLAKKPDEKPKEEKK